MEMLNENTVSGTAYKHYKICMINFIIFTYIIIL